MPEIIDIVFDAPPGPECGRFIEVENADGQSITVGEWIERPGGLWALRLTGSDFTDRHITPQQLEEVALIAKRATEANENAKGILTGQYDNYDGADGAREVADLCQYISTLVKIVDWLVGVNHEE